MLVSVILRAAMSGFELPPSIETSVGLTPTELGEKLLALDKPLRIATRKLVFSPEEEI